jgi:hypothetical protein
MTHTSIHLTPEQIDLLVACRTIEDSQSARLKQAAGQDHLQVCAECRYEVELLRATVSDLRTATAAWAAHQTPAFQPAHRLRVLVPATNARPFRLAWAGGLGTLALAAGLLLTCNQMPNLAAGNPSARNVQPAIQTAAPAGPTDEALLDGVETDLADSLPPTLAPLSVTASH